MNKNKISIFLLLLLSGIYTPPTQSAGMAAGAAGLFTVGVVHYPTIQTLIDTNATHALSTKHLLYRASRAITPKNIQLEDPLDTEFSRDLVAHGAGFALALAISCLLGNRDALTSYCGAAIAIKGAQLCVPFIQDYVNLGINPVSVLEASMQQYTDEDIAKKTATNLFQTILLSPSERTSVIALKGAFYQKYVPFHGIGLGILCVPYALLKK